MTYKAHSFCIVCIANYCRSPVLENLLKRKYSEKFEIMSAGLSPIPQPSMDIRSMQFLESLGIKNIVHTPKRISKKMLNDCDYFIAVDLLVLIELNKLFPKYKEKFKLATSQFKNIELNDPYMFGPREYKDIMTNIQFVSENIDLELL